MSCSGPLESVCGPSGYRADLEWAPAGAAARLGASLAERMPGPVTKNPHLSESGQCAASSPSVLTGWAVDTVTAPPLIDAVREMLGDEELFVENTFLVIKQPGDGFAVPPHQDGINDRLILDPARSVAIWLALTDASEANGCLEVVPGSHRDGYRRLRRDSDRGGGRPFTIDAVDPTAFVAVPLRAGQACAMDVRLVHRSGPNVSSAPRVGLNVRVIRPGALTLLAGAAPPRLVRMSPAITEEEGKVGR